MNRYDEHLTPALMARAQRHLVAKAISEFSHERLLAPVAAGERWTLTTRDGRTTYSFTARVHALEHWVLDLDSLTRTVGGQAAELDAQQFVAEFAPRLGIPEQLLPTYLEELASTLGAAAWKLGQPRPTADELVHADYRRSKRR